MKKILSVLLTIVMFSSLITPLALADEASITKLSGNVQSFSGVSFVNNQVVYGETDDDKSQKIPFTSGSGNKSGNLFANGMDVKPVAGDKIKISFALARSTTGNVRINFGMIGKAGTTSFTYFVGQHEYYFNTGKFEQQKNTNVVIPTSYNTIVTPVQTWNTYDLVYTVGRDDDAATDEIETVANTYSMYVNGSPVVENEVFKNANGLTYSAITEVNNIYFFSRSTLIPIYIDDVSLTHYPASIADQCVITADPMADDNGDSYADIDTNKYFVIDTDGSLAVNDLSVTSAGIAELAPDNWIFTYVNTDGTDEITNEGYLIMKNTSAGTVYYKKVTSAQSKDLLNEHFDAVFTNSLYGYGIRRARATASEERKQEKGLEGKSSSNGAVYTKFTNPQAGEIVGFVATPTSKYVSSGHPYSSMVETGRIAYEVSVLIPSVPTRALAFEVYYNGTVASGSSLVGGAVWSPVASFDVNGKLATRSDKGWYIEPEFEGFKINFGEWYRLTCIMDTNSDTGEFYINGQKAAELKNDVDLKTLNYINVGFSTRGATDTSADTFTFAFDDVSIKKVRSDWTVPTLELTSNDENVTIDNKNGVIFGEFDSLQAFSDTVNIPEGATYEFYTEKTITSAAEEGTVGKYLLVKNTDETIIREYVIANDDLAVTGLDVSALNTESGTKSVTVSIENMTAADINTMVAIASYSSDGALVALDTLTKPAVFKEVTNYTVSLSVTEEEPVSEIKAFVWKYGNLSPYVKNVSTNNN